MRLPRRTTGLLLLGLLLCAASPLPYARAQENANATATARILIAAGDVLELFAVTSAPDAAADWVLTRGGEFVEAGRERIFRTRLTQEGPYLLDGQLRSAEGIRRLQMEITVPPPQDEEFDQSPAGSTNLIVMTEPPTTGNGVHIPHSNPVLALIPTPGFSGPIAVDLDPGSDTDGDGDPRDDSDLADTLFSTEHNTLHIWFTMPEDAKPLHLTTIGEHGTLLTQDIDMVGEAAAMPTGTVNGVEGADGVVRFSFGVNRTIDPATVVYAWDFGDGTQSLVEEPVHRYVTNGDYEVTVTLRDLATARVLAQGTTTVTVTTATGAAGAASSATASSVASASSGSGVGSLLWTLFKIAIVLLVCIALGAAGVRLAMRFLHREGRLQKALEQAEGKLLKPDAGSAATPEIAPATMRLKRPAIGSEREATAERPVTPSEVIDQEPVSATTEPSTLTPPPPPPPPPPATAPAEAPAATMEASTPSWLQTPATPPPPLPTDTAPPSPSDFIPSAPESPAPDASPPVTETTPGVPATPATGQPVLSEDDLLPTWLKDEEVKEVEDVKEVREVTEVPAPSPSSTASAPAPIISVSAADEERLERERERKRRKRQRYRENVKKRAAAELSPAGTGPGTGSGPQGDTAPVVSAPSPSPFPSASPKPVPQDIPPAETPAAATPFPEPEDKVTFMIKAEGVEKLNEENGNTSADGTKSAA